MVDPLSPLFGTSTRDLFMRGEFVVSRGGRERLPPWMTSGALGSIEELCKAYRGPLEIAQGSTQNGNQPPGSPSYVGRGGQTPVKGVRADMLLRLGLTVYFANLRSMIAPASAFAEAIEAELEVPPCVGIGAFANAPGSGLPLHHDSHHQLFVQLSGEKTLFVRQNEGVSYPGIPHSPTWRIHPFFTSVYPGGAPSEESLVTAGLETISLSPGDCLFLPAGTWHRTAGQTETCLSLTVAVRAPSVLDLLICAAGYLGMQDPSLRAPAYGAFPRDTEPKDAEKNGDAEKNAFGLPTGSIERFAQGLTALDVRQLERAWSARSLQEVTPAAYPMGKFSHFLRIPSTEITVQPVDDSWFSCQVRAVGAPQASELRFHREAGPLLDGILAWPGMLSADALGARFEDYEVAEISSFLDQLARVGALTPVPLAES